MSLTRKRFLGAIAAAAGAAVSGAQIAHGAPAAPKVDVITQAELEAALEAEAAVNHRMFELRDRIVAGARVQPGALYVCKDNNCDDLTEDNIQMGSLEILGVEISPSGEETFAGEPDYIRMATEQGWIFPQWA
jgi:hypothetical protein